MLRDVETAPISTPLKAALHFVGKLTHEPAAVGADDVRQLRAAGVSDEAIEDAINVTTAFNLINRLADALEFRISSPGAYRRTARMLLKFGYDM